MLLYARIGAVLELYRETVFLPKDRRLKTKIELGDFEELLVESCMEIAGTKALDLAGKTFSVE